MRKKKLTKAEVIKQVRVIFEKETQQEMAERLGVSQTDISFFEQGTRKPTSKFMESFYKEHRINLLAHPDVIEDEEAEE